MKEKSVNLIRMKNSYGYLYIIENDIRQKINIQLNKIHGSNWISIMKNKYQNNISKKSIDSMYYHELLSFIKMVPELNEIYSKDILKDLCKLTIIRNKVAHCTLIDEYEFQYLLDLYIKVIDS